MYRITEEINTHLESHINLLYEYDTVEIDTLLFLKIKKSELDLHHNIPVKTKHLANNYLTTYLISEKQSYEQRQESLGTSRTLLIPINIENIKIVGLALFIDKDNQLIRAIYIDVDQEPAPDELKPILKSAYSGNCNIENMSILLTTNKHSNAVIVIESLLLIARSQLEKILLNNEDLLNLRSIHIKLLEENFPTLHFAEKQRTRISDFKKKKTYQLSYLTQHRDHLLSPELNNSFFKLRQNLQKTNDESLNKMVCRKLSKLPAFSSLSSKDYIIERIAGGSNVSYKIKTSFGDFFLRISRRIYSVIAQLYENEGANIKHAETLNICAKLRHYNPNDGTLMTDFVQSTEILSPAKFESDESCTYLENFVSQLYKLHSSPMRFKNDVNVFDRLKTLFLFIAGEINDFFPFHECQSLLSDVLKVEALLNNYHAKKVPSHNDANPYNALLTKNGLILIDWERSGNNDPAWDLAYLSLSSHLSSNQEEKMLSIYRDFGAQDSTLENRIFLFKPIIEIWKTFWLIFQALDENDILSKDDFTCLAQKRLENCKSLLNETFSYQLADSPNVRLTRIR